MEILKSIIDLPEGAMLSESEKSQWTAILTGLKTAISENLGGDAMAVDILETLKDEEIGTIEDRVKTILEASANPLIQ